jgi:hypothetical protein
MTRALVVLATALVAAPLARADGDPASDYLLTQRVFVPFDGKVSPARAAQLQQIVLAAKRRGYEIRVALIVTRYDLGAVPSLWRKPHTYARFLSQELFFVYKNRLLVVMPNGYGAALHGKPLAAAQRVVDDLPPPGEGGDRIAAAAVTAVANLAHVAIPPLRVPESGSSHTRDRLVLLAAVLGVLGLAAAGYALRRLRS